MRDLADAHDCVYATAGWQDADERAIGVLLDRGWTPLIVSVGRDVPDLTSLAAAVSAKVPSGGLVVATAAVLPALGGLGREVVDVAPSVDLEAHPFHAPWIDAFLLGVPPHAHLVLSLRAHRPDTRIHDVIDAFARIPRRNDVHEDFPDPYLIIGHTGPGTDALRRAVREAGVRDRTRIIGSVPSADLVPLLGRGACFVTVSGVDEVPVSVLQAMACGTPVIAGDVPAMRDWVEDGVTGFLVPVGDAPALSDVIGRVVATYPTEVVLRARRQVEERADWSREADRLIERLPTR